MKKLLVLGLVLFMAVGLFACGEDPVDDAAPTISGVGNVSIKIGETIDLLDGVTATDEEDGDLTADIYTRGTVDNQTQGNYTITYGVIDSAKNVTEVDRVVSVTVGEAPVISGVEDKTITFEVPFNPLLGVTATDEEDGSLTAAIIVSGSVNVAAVGTYTLTYQVTDSAGNVTQEDRVITVEYGDKTVVTLAHWGLGTVEENNLLRRRIAAFNDQSETIEIQILEYTGSYDDFLASQAAADAFPDVFISGNVPNHITMGYAGDITEVALADPDWGNIPVALRDAITYNGRIYAVPSALNYLGYYANLDLIENTGTLTDYTALGHTYADFIAAIENATDSTKTDGTSTAGLNHPADFVNWLPATLDSESDSPLGITHFALAGDEFLFNSQPVKDALAEAKAIMDNGWGMESYDNTDPDGDGPLVSPRVEKFGASWWNTFNTGQLAFQWDGTWSASSRASNAATAGFDVQFIGIPGNKVVGVSDFLGISKTAADKEAAYEVAKWITFGTDGINAMFDIVENTVPGEGEVSLAISGLPISNVQSVIDQWFENYPVAGVQEVFEAAAAGTVQVLVEGNKFVPGFITARYTYNTGIDATISRPTATEGSTLSIGDLIWDAQFGKLVYSDYMTLELQNLINYEFIKAQIALNNAISGS